MSCSYIFDIPTGLLLKILYTHSQQTKSTSLYCIKLLFFNIGTQFAYCAVRIEFLEIIKVNVCLRELRDSGTVAS